MAWCAGAMYRVAHHIFSSIVLQNMQIMHNATFEPFRCDGLLIVCAL